MIDEIQDRNSRKNLYDALKDSYDLGSFEQFDKDMQSQEARKNLWDAINADYDVGTFEQFDKDMMGDNVKPEQQDQGPSNTQQSQPQAKTTQQLARTELPITSITTHQDERTHPAADNASTIHAMPPQASLNVPQPQQSAMSLNDRQKLWTWRDIKPTLKAGQNEQQYSARLKQEKANPTSTYPP